MAFTDKYVNSAGAGTADGSSEPNAMSWATMVSTINTAGVGGSAGLRYLAKGIISRGASDTITGGGTLTSPCVIEGYSATPGDFYLGHASDGSLITTNYAAVNYSSAFRWAATGSLVLLKGLFVTGGTGSSITCGLGVNSAAIACKFVCPSTLTSSGAVSGAGGTLLHDCDVENSGSGSGTPYGVNLSATGSKVDACRVKITNSNAVGIILSGGGAVAYGNTIFGNGPAGISVTTTSAVPFIRSNTISGFTESILYASGMTNLLAAIGNMLTDSTAFAINQASSSNAIVFARNRTRDNPSGPIGSGGDWALATTIGHVTSGSGAAVDYVASGSNDYRLLATSPAVGGNLPASASIGALQRLQTGGGGCIFGSSIITPGGPY